MEVEQASRPEKVVDALVRAEESFKRAGILDTDTWMYLAVRRSAAQLLRCSEHQVAVLRETNRQIGAPSPSQQGHVERQFKEGARGGWESSVGKGSRGIGCSKGFFQAQNTVACLSEVRTVA